MKNIIINESFETITLNNLAKDLIGRSGLEKDIHVTRIEKLKAINIVSGLHYANLFDDGSVQLVGFDSLTDVMQTIINL